MEDCHRCKLRDTCTFPVGGHGKGVIMYIGEAPGELEDKYGIPFIGLSGRLLRKAVGDDNYFTKAVKCRPPNNRKPTKEEIGACFPHLVKEIEEVKPAMIVFLGRTAQSLSKRIQEMYPEIPQKFFYHPSYALRTGKASQWVEEIKKEMDFYKEVYSWSLENLQQPL